MCAHQVSMGSEGVALVRLEPVPPALRWPLLVTCRDTNYWHQSDVRLMYPDTIVDFLRDELYGEQWSEHQLEEVLDCIYA